LPTQPLPQAHLAWESNPPFRLILHGTRVSLDTYSAFTYALPNVLAPQIVLLFVEQSLLANWGYFQLS